MSTTRSSARVGSTKSASTTTACGWTGPPTWTRSSSPDERGQSGGTASATVTVETRLRTTPIAPSSPCSPTSTTVRRKFGSSSAGPATSRVPRSELHEAHSRPPGSGPGGRATAFSETRDLPGGALDLDPVRLRDQRPGVSEHPELDPERARGQRRPGEHARLLVELEARRDPARERGRSSSPTRRRPGGATSSPCRPSRPSPASSCGTRAAPGW